MIRIDELTEEGLATLHLTVKLTKGLEAEPPKRAVAALACALIDAGKKLELSPVETAKVFSTFASTYQEAYDALTKAMTT